jgi:hypothetical protein
MQRPRIAAGHVASPQASIIREVLVDDTSEHSACGLASIFNNQGEAMLKAGLPGWAYLAAVAVFGLAHPLAGQETPTSTCVQCHTDVKKLIRLSWEVEKVRGKSQLSAENEGEG